MNLDLLKHELCCFPYEHPEMSKADAAHLTEAYSHYHRIMTDYNNQWLRNAVYLNENFLKLWTQYQDPKKLLDHIVEHMTFQASINNTKDDNDKV